MPNANEIIEQIKRLDNIQDFNKIKDFIESQNDDLEEKILSDFSNYTFKIPYYQRGYRWSKDNIQTLLDDLKEFIDDESEGNIRYILQPLAIAKKEKENEFEVIDGQQRLTTLFLIHKYLDQKSKWYELKYEFEHDDSGDSETEEMSSLLKGDIKPYTYIDGDDGKNEDSINKFYVKQAYTAITEWFSNNQGYKEKIRSLITETDDSKKVIMFLWFEVDYESRHAAFQNINSGKIQLTNSDLIKALFLSSSSSIANKEEVAAQFEQMERQFDVDKFWFMFNKRDINKLKGQSRIDYIFNLAINMMNYSSKENKSLEISYSAYQLESRKAFFYMTSHKTKSLDEQWKEIRSYFVILMEFYENPYYFHYIGYLIWNEYNTMDEKMKLIMSLLKEYTTSTKSDFKNKLIKTIRNSLGCNKKFNNLSPEEKINKYWYQKTNDQENVIKERGELIKIFLLHNIQTILSRYELLKNNLYSNFEYFPFELYHAQKWNIEHIDSQTENELKTDKDKLDWLDGIHYDYPEFEPSEQLKKQFSSVENNVENIFNYLREKLKSDTKTLEDVEKKNNLFSEYHNDFITWYKENIKIANDKKNEPISDSDIHGIGNLVLLDEHTNTSYHNALFVRKRRIILMTSGLIKELDDDYQEDIKNMFIPICTRDIFLKSYNTSSNFTINYWSKQDYDAYVKDIVSKLKPFLENNSEKEKTNEQ